MKIKWMKVGALALLVLASVGGVSVVGLLQSTARVGTSGIIVQPPPPSPSPSPSPPPPPPPEPVVEIGVYSNSGCTQEMTAIDWGTIEAGSSVGQKLYVKNEGDQSVTLSLTTSNWVPPEADGYMDLSWDYDGSAIEPGAKVEVTLTLSVASSITGIDSFSFDIDIIGSAS